MVNNQSDLIKSVAMDWIWQAELKPQSPGCCASAQACGAEKQDFTMPRIASESRPGACCAKIVPAGMASSCRIPVSRLNALYIGRGGSRFGPNAGRGAQSTYPLSAFIESKAVSPYPRRMPCRRDQIHDRLGKKPWLRA